MLTKDQIRKEVFDSFETDPYTPDYWWKEIGTVSAEITKRTELVAWDVARSVYYDVVIRYYDGQNRIERKTWRELDNAMKYVRLWMHKYFELLND